MHVMSELKKYLTLEHAQCESFVISDSTSVQNYRGGTLYTDGGHCTLG